MTLRSLAHLAVLAVLPSPLPVRAADESALDIIAAADRARNPQQPFRVTVTVVEYRDGAAHDKVVLTNHVKLDPSTNQYRNLVRYNAPAHDAGKLVLLNGGNMWFYDPASQASIRISPQQRLTGQASNGDVLTANLARDYQPKLIGEEEIRDATDLPKHAFRIELMPATRDAIYARIETWVERGTYQTVKSRYYSSSGRLLKVAYFSKYESALGGVRPTETIIIDAVNAKMVTKIAYTDMRPAEIRDAWFQRDYLPRLNLE